VRDVKAVLFILVVGILNKLIVLHIWAPLSHLISVIGLLKTLDFDVTVN